MRLDTDHLAWENVRKGIYGQIELLATASSTLYEEAGGVVGDEPPARIYFVGCGDSYFCGLAARYAVEWLTRVPTEALESLEFSRYAVRSAPPNSLVVAVSNSGDVARTVEAVKFARQAGLKTIAVTYNPASRLAKQADAVLAFDYRDVGFGPGTMSYMASVLSLLAVGLRVAVASGGLKEPAARTECARIAALAEVLRATIDASAGPAEKLADTLSDTTQIFYLGAGPNYGTALFAMAKMIEAARHNTVAQELEEWAHEQYFCCGPGTVTIVIAPPGAAIDRAREQLRAVRDMKGIAVAVCSADDEETAALADVVLPVVGEVAEELSPLVYLAAPELVALYFAVRTEKVMLGFDDEWRKEVNFRQIFGSTIRDRVELQGESR